MKTQFEISKKTKSRCANFPISIYVLIVCIRDRIHVFHSNDSAATFESNSPKCHSIVCGIPKYHTIVCGIPREVRPRF